MYSTNTDYGQNSRRDIDRHQRPLKPTRKPALRFRRTLLYRPVKLVNSGGELLSSFFAIVANLLFSALAIVLKLRIDFMSGIFRLRNLIICSSSALDLVLGHE